MKRKERLTLMYKDYEVLSFLVDYKNNKVTVLEKLEHFDKAPYGMTNKGVDINQILFRFFYSRMIPASRWDHQLILKNTGCSSSFELSFKGHGLSLSNHFWFKRKGENFKYKDINFFTNKWDDGFSKAIFSGDYDALKNCDLNVPDIVTPGWSVKTWVYDNGPKLYKLGIVKDQYEDCLGEVLASKLAQRIFKDNEVVNYELVKIGDKYASVSPVMTKVNEEIFPISRIMPLELNELYYERNIDKNKTQEFFKKIKDFSMPEAYDLFVKLSVIKSLCFVSDLHFGNISVIKNSETGELRVAPIYDLAGAFGTSETGRKFLSNLNKGTYILVYYFFSTLDATWDYSWYDPSKLDGFEKEIKEILSKSEFYTPELIERIIAVFNYQKEALDKMAKHSS